MAKKYESITKRGDPNYWRQKWTAQEKERRDREAFEYMLADPRGRWFLMELFNNTYYNATTYTGNSQSFFNEGKRSVTVNIVNRISRLLGLQGIKLKQQAEQEYAAFVLEAERLISEKEE